MRKSWKKNHIFHFFSTCKCSMKFTPAHSRTVNWILIWLLAGINLKKEREIENEDLFQTVFVLCNYVALLVGVGCTDFAELLRGNCSPTASQTDHSGCIHQSVTERMAHCGNKNKKKILFDRFDENFQMIFLPFRPTPFTCQSSALRLAGLAVRTTMCCISRHVKLRLASKAKAQIPAANGADADVPVWLAVHEWCKSVVTI